jgi:hypothetical protein
MKDYVKTSDLEFVVQLNNFSSKLPAYVTVLGLPATTVVAAANDAAYFGFAVTAIDTADTYKQGWTEIKKSARKGKGTSPISGFPSAVNVTTPPTAVVPGIEDRFRALAQNIKTNPAYTKAIGEDLGIVAPEDSTELIAPTLKVKLDGGLAVISFNKAKSSGIRLYCKRGTEAGFTFLAVDTKSPYTDSRPNQNPGSPEKREYYAFYQVDDKQVGNQSAVVEITVN